MSSVMDRIREAAARAAAGPLADARERPSFPRVAAQSPFPPEAGLEDYLARFRTELETLTGKVYGPLDAEDVADKVIELIREKAPGVGVPGGTSTAETGGAAGASSVAGGEENPHPNPLPKGEGTSLPPLPLGEGRGEGGYLQVLSWTEAESGCPGLADRLRRASIEMVPGDVPNDADHRKVLEKLAALEVGLSGAVAGLADTGSLVVASGPGRSRVASLLPPLHIAVLPVDRLYPTMQDWLAGGGVELARQTANLVVITGCSRTSDIELQLTLGMHGPKELHVVLYRE